MYHVYWRVIKWQKGLSPNGHPQTALQRVIHVVVDCLFFGPREVCTNSSLPLSTMSSFSLTTASRRERSDPGRIAPFLTNVTTHHGQLTLIPPQNAGKIRKGGKSAKNLERARTERRREVDEPRFNVAAPSSPRTASRRGNIMSERSPRPPPAGTSRLSRGM
jgi:hypothetical protein